MPVSRRDEVMKQVVARRGGIEKLLNATFFSLFTVEVARHSAVNLKGQEALEYCFKVNVYRQRGKLGEAPRATLVVALDAENKKILADVRRELARCGLD